MIIDNLPEDRTAKFNSGIDKLYRLGSLKRGCHDARVAKDYRLWFGCLQGIRSEMHSKLTRTGNDKKKERAERDEADEYEYACRLYLEGKEDVEIVLNGERGLVKSIDIYQLLYEYELWLSDIEEKYKFGMPDMDSAYDALK